MKTLERIKALKEGGKSYYDIAVILQRHMPGKIKVHPNTIYNWLNDKHGISGMTKHLVNEALNEYERKGGENEESGYKQLDRR